jgi:hypothetical protein
MKGTDEELLHMTARACLDKSARMQRAGQSSIDGDENLVGDRLPGTDWNWM